ncbi:MAG TPA: dihydrolipoamide acetyltransferase family protein [Myxococcales bacterium]|nr:dihydrolipoamide acetyltransferase family protein [Myxococcales bacterium]
MRFEFKLPDIGEGVIEGEVVRWLVKVGESVAADQPLVEVMTDKATVVIPSPKAGKVLERRGEEGGMVKVHDTLVVLETDGAEAGAKAATPAATSPVKPTPPAVAGRAPEAPRPPGPVAVAAVPAPHVRATPVTRKLAAEHGIDLAAVPGSGPGGRVLKADVLSAVGGAPAALPAPRPAPRIVSGAEDERIPIRGLRKRIAEKMARSKRTAAHFTFVEEVDCTRLVELRNRINGAQAEAEGGVKLSFLPFIVKALIEGLRRYPTLNASVDDEKNELVVKHRYHVGIAAATPDGLIVPVIHDADRKSLRELAHEITRLAADARAGKSRLDDLQGGTITITSLGPIGGLFATPVINHPEVAIVGVHKMRPTPVVRDGQIVVRDVMHLSCAFDHRVIDGSVGAQFTYEVIRYLENPELLMLELT